jgi:hypothetical protein
MNLQNWKRLRVTAILLLTLSLPFLSSPSAWARIGDKAEVAPGKIPPTEKDHYLGNSSVTVKLEYPRSFILQETVGDLAFTVALNEPRRQIEIYIPPEFKVNTGSSYVWTNITNNYANIGITKAGSFDNIAPNWYKVSITNRAMEPGAYSIRVFNVTAPSIVGLYFFKVFTDRTSIGAKNFPSVVVSADPNPAYVSGTIRYGGRLPLPGYIYGDPISLNKTSGEGGKVCATGITTEGRIVVGQAFFNASANYALYGLAPGRYTLNATAAGYAPGELQYPILLKAGQSMEGVDIFLEHSPVTTVVALSRWMKQPAPWGQIRNETDVGIVVQSKKITLEVFDSWNTTIRLLNATTEKGSTFHTFEYHGERDLDGHIPQDNSSYVGGIGPGRYYFRVWVNGYVQPSAANEWAWRNDCAVVFSRNEQDRRIDILLEKTGTLNVKVHFMDSTQMMLRENEARFNGTLIVEAYNLDEEMRARNSTRVITTVDNPIKTASVELTGLFNSSRDYGLPPGEYIVFARLAPRGPFADFFYPYYVSVGEVYLPSAYRYGPRGHKVTIGEGLNEISFYVVLQGGLNLTIYSVTPQRPFSITAWKYPGSAINVEIRDRYGVEVYGSFRLPQENKILPDGRLVPVNNTASVIGLDDGVYSIHIFTYGYVQERAVFFSVRRGEIADISAYVVTGGEIKITLVFQKQRILSAIDTYRNYWDSSEPKVPVRFEIYDSRMQFVGANATYMPIVGADRPTVFSNVTAGFRTYYGNAATRWINYYDTTDGSRQRDYGLVSDWYTLKVYVPGYYQKSDPVIEVRRGGETSVIILLERMAHLYGKVRTFNTYFANYTRISWVNVDAIGEEMTIRSCTLDGDFEMWLVPGSYLVVFSLPGYQDRSVRLSMPEGSDVQVDFQLLPLGFKL